MQEKNNFYASFSNVQKSDIRNAFEKEGWISRKCTWADFELSNEWSTLVLEGDSANPLLNGIVQFTEQNLKNLDRILESLMSKYQYEFYDQNGNCIVQKNNAS